MQRRRQNTPHEVGASRAGGLGFFFQAGIAQLGGFGFDFHVAELVRVENLATLLALDELRVFFARHDADSWMFAGGIHDLGSGTGCPNATIVTGKGLPAGGSI